MYIRPVVHLVKYMNLFRFLKFNFWKNCLLISAAFVILILWNNWFAKKCFSKRWLQNPELILITLEIALAWQWNNQEKHDSNKQAGKEIAQYFTLSSAFRQHASDRFKFRKLALANLLKWRYMAKVLAITIISAAGWDKWEFQSYLKYYNALRKNDID